MLGFDREQRVVNLGDSAELNAFLYDNADAPVPQDEITSVAFIVQKPDGTQATTAGTVNSDGSAYLLYNGADQVGEYIAVAKFTLDGGIIRSTRSDFVVSDPFASDVTPLQLQDYDPLDDTFGYRFISGRVWDKMEDLFDSTDGGPWMRDMTLNVFSAEKIPEFIEEAIFDINVYNPPTEFAIDEFTTPLQVQGQPTRPNANATVLVQGTWIAVIRHLMRTYAEQPVPTGGQITYEDRRDYLQRWGTVYQIEFQHYDHLVKLWKRQFLGLHQSKQLVSNKAGRLLPAPLRSRNIGRGYY